MTKRAAGKATRPSATSATLGFEAHLWPAANALRGSMDAAEYKHAVLGLVFLKYISDALEAHHAKLEAERHQGADPEDPDLPAPHACLPDRQARHAGEYRAENIFWGPPQARWEHLQ